MITCVQRRVCEVQRAWVCYCWPTDPSRIIWRTVDEHVEATGKAPLVGDLIDFDMEDDWLDGPSYSYTKRN